MYETMIGAAVFGLIGITWALWTPREDGRRVIIIASFALLLAGIAGALLWRP